MRRTTLIHIRCESLPCTTLANMLILCCLVGDRDSDEPLFSTVRARTVVELDDKRTHAERRHCRPALHPCGPKDILPPRGESSPRTAGVEDGPRMPHARTADVSQPEGPGSSMPQLPFPASVHRGWAGGGCDAATPRDDPHFRRCPLWMQTCFHGARRPRFFRSRPSVRGQRLPVPALRLGVSGGHSVASSLSVVARRAW